jgi:hypothetical protein
MIAGRALTVLTAALCLAGLGCGKSAIDSARATWEQTVATCDTYHYVAVDQSFIGITERTTIAISRGQPAGRSFVRTQGFGPSPQVVASWTEDAAHVGQHAEGRPAETMEQLYDDCAKNVLSQDPGQNQITFETDTRGVLLTCQFVPDGCADDCAMGVVIQDFACGAPV